MNKKLHSFSLIGNFLSAYGVTPQMCEFLLKSFRGAGHRVYPGGQYLNTPRRVLDMLHSLYRHRKEIEFALVDTFSGFAFYWSFLSGLFCRILGIPYAVVLRGGGLASFSKNHSFEVKWHLTGAKKVVAPSSFLSKWCANQFHILPKIIPQSIELNHYPFMERKFFELNILWVRRFHYIYNPQLALKALWLLKKQFSNVRMTMAGPDAGSLEPCKILRKELGLEREVLFTGIIEKKQWGKLAGDHSIFLNTSEIDNTPFTLIEAAALGLPIVTTNAGGISKLFFNSRECILCPKNNPDLIASAIAQIHLDGELGRSLAEHAREKVENFEAEKVCRQWEQLFSELAE